MKSPQDEDPEEGVRDLVDLAMRKMDGDKDGKLSYQDYLQAVTSEPLLLEAFGQCLPADLACQAFIMTLTGNNWMWVVGSTGNFFFLLFSHRDRKINF